MTHAEQVFYAAFSHISPTMRSQIMPQLEQIKAYPENKWTGVGKVFRVDTAQARGWYWWHVPFEGCLVSRMNWLALENFSLEEKPLEDFVCIGNMQTQELELMNDIWKQKGLPPLHLHIDTDDFETMAQCAPQATVSFPYSAGTYRFEIKAQTVYSSTTVCLTIALLCKLAQQFSELHEAVSALIDRPLIFNNNKELITFFAKLLPSNLSEKTLQVDTYAQVLTMLSLITKSTFDDSCTHTESAQEVACSSCKNKQFSQAIIALLQNSLSCPPTLDELARVFHVGRTKLCTQFKKEQGQSIGDVLTQLRLHKIEEGLLCGKTLKQLAHELGYTSTASVRIFFIKQKGMSPKSWLKEQGC
ncbi:MAG: AraC family transcriptional regulator [Atopobium sp.]|uniref:helix-turn-helix domain-containing protein n=1 Tax=Atopobium sp. TaxID=1872650 RepID=UPI002A748E33|nr:AraC family transcriptional regulator [Atopobium sp.]MDY2788717.1 AraC family transcriptional regulator [Atopobium sp.]